MDSIGTIKLFEYFSSVYFFIKLISMFQLKDSQIKKNLDQKAFRGRDIIFIREGILEKRFNLLTEGQKLRGISLYVWLHTSRLFSSQEKSRLVLCIDIIYSPDLTSKESFNISWAEDILKNRIITFLTNKKICYLEMRTQESL